MQPPIWLALAEAPKALFPKVPPPPPPSDSMAKALEFGGDGKGKGKGKDKGKEGPGLCHNFAKAKGCKYRDNCKFVHDRGKCSEAEALLGLWS